jgi:hypothetical protein
MFRESLVMVLVVGICWMLRRSVREHFENDHIYENESMRVMKSCEFSLSCCPSTYSNDKGCMCMDQEESTVFGTRGFNSVYEN